jgi:hypothetical protein
MLTDLTTARTIENRIGELGDDVASLVDLVDQELVAGVTAARRQQLRGRALELAGEASQVRAELQQAG